MWPSLVTATRLVLGAIGIILVLIGLGLGIIPFDWRCNHLDRRIAEKTLTEVNAVQESTTGHVCLPDWTGCQVNRRAVQTAHVFFPIGSPRDLKVTGP